MNRVVDRLAVAIFFVFLVAPVASYLAVPGSSVLSGAKLGRLFGSDPSARDRMANNLIAESPYSKRFIRLKNGFDYYVVRSVNTGEVVSGEWPWLFYKPQFGGGRCLEESDYGAALNAIEAMRVVAAGAGINMVVSVSPDKSVIYPGKMGSQAGALAGCKLKSAAAWRSWAKRNGSSVIDHREALLLALDRGAQIYFVTDTHWNQLGYAYMVRQLADRLLDVQLPEPYSPEMSLTARRTDLRNDMLKLWERESISEVPKEWVKLLQRSASPGLPNAVIVHDSFYHKFRPILKLLFNRGRFFLLSDSRPARIVEAIKTRPALLLVNSVERSFFVRVNGPGQFYNWQGPLGEGLLAANKAAAGGCSYGSAPALRFDGLAGDGTSGGYVTDSNEPKIFFDLPKSSGRICVRIHYSAGAPSGGLLYLPRADADHAFAPGYAVPLPGDDMRSLELVLPATLAGLPLRLDPVSGTGIPIAKLGVEIGFLAGGR